MRELDWRPCRSAWSETGAAGRQAARHRLEKVHRPQDALVVTRPVKGIAALAVVLLAAVLPPLRLLRARLRVERRRGRHRRCRPRPGVLLPHLVVLETQFFLAP